MTSMPVASLFLSAFLLSGCMISEQAGQGLEDLTFHFDTEFNRIVLFARSGALAAVAIWLFAGSRKKAVPIVAGVTFLGAGLILFARDYPTLSGYRVEILGEGMVIAIPPEPEKRIPWSSIEELYIEGMGQTSSQPKDAVAKMLELPDWHSMTITEAGGVTHEVDLKRLSMEQRQTLWRAIARRAHLVEIDE